MKKILALILVVCLSVGCFVACGEEEPAATKKPTAAPATTAPADDDATTEESAAPEESEEPAPSDDAGEEEPAPSDDAGEEEPAPSDDASEDTGADWEMPDNSAIDCFAFDLRGGETSYMEYAEGYTYLQTGEISMNETFLEGTDPDGSKPGYVTMYIEGTDPYIYFYTNEMNPDAAPIDFNLQDYPFLKIVLRNNTPDAGFEMFLWEQGTNLTASHCIGFSGISSNDTEFKTYIIDLRSSGASNTLTVSPRENGKIDNRHVSAFRFDAPAAEGATDPTFDIQYLGFFKTAADAQAYK